MGPRMHTITFVAIEFMETHIVDHRQIICRTSSDSGKKRPIDGKSCFKYVILTISDDQIAYRTSADARMLGERNEPVQFAHG
jgi:hypothetical protein